MHSKTQSTPVPTPSTQSTPESTIATPPPLDLLTIKTNKSSYKLGEDVNVEFTFQNKFEKTIDITFPPKLKIIHWVTENVVYTFPQGNKRIKLKPGEKISYVFKWNQRDENEMQVNPGIYYVDVEVVRDDGAKYYNTSNKILIQYPQGAMEKTIEPNQSKTAKGVTVILKKVELTHSEVRVYVLAKIPSSTPKPSKIPLPEPTPPDELWPPLAHYQVNNDFQKSKVIGIRTSKEGYLFTWVLDPIPSDAKEMTFVVDKFGKWEGPWRFQISLT